MPQMAKNYRHFINQAKPDPSYPTAYNHILVDNIENLKEILSKPTDYMSFDTETTGLSPEKDFIVGYSFCLDGKNCYYVPVKHSSGGLGEESLDLIYNKMCSVKTVAMFNMRFDVRMMEWHGFTDLPFGHQYETAFVDSHFIKYDMSKVKVFDVQVSVFLADTNVGYPSLKWAEEWFLGWKGDTFSETLGDATNFYYLSPEEAYFYAATDALGTYLLGIKTRRFYDEAKTSGILDNNFLYPLCKFEEELVDIDVDVLKGYSQYLSNEIEACQKRCWERAGTPFNLGSTKEKSDVLEALGVYTGERTKKGTMKTGRDVIEKALNQMDKADPNYKLLEDMVLYNTLVKQKSSYVDNIIDMCDNPIRPNKLRFNYKNCAVPTGRLAAGGDKKQDFFANLNIQNQPKPHVLNYFVGNIDRVKQTNPDLFLNAYNDDGSLKDRWDYTNEVRTYSIERVLNFIFTPIYYKGKFGGSNPDDFPFKLPRDEERLIEGFEQHLNIRSAYLPRPGHYWVSLDFNAEELRLPTLITKEKVWMDAFVHGRDIHRSTAEAIWGKENYTKDKRKIAKCVSGDTLINTTDGLIPIKDLSDYRVEDSFTDINCRVVTRDGVHKVDYFYYGGIKDTYKIETDKGYKIEISNTHPLLVLRNNKDEWVKSSELKVGDLIRTCNYVYDVDKYQEVSVNLWYNLETQGTNLPKVVIDENYGFLLGAILGDGTCGVKGVKFMTWKEDFPSIELVISRVLDNIGLSSTRPYNDRNLVVWSIGSTRFIRFLKKIGISNGSRKILRVPECIFRSPNSVIGEFLSGLFETDGTVSKDTISFCSSNLKFVEDIQQLLLKIGIRSKITSELNKVYNRYYHKIRIYKEDCKLFEVRVGFKSDRKKSRLAEMSSRYKTKNLDYTEITSIAKSRNEVFDLTVSDVHEFVGNGIVCHNTANFGILYGMNYYSFADRYAMSLEEAQKFVNDFKTSLSTLFSWVSKVEKLGADKGTLYTMFGRPRRVSYWMTSSDYKQIAFGKRTAVNTIIQGSGADVLKIAFIKLWNKFFVNWNNHKYISFLNTVHDEINYSIDKSKVNEITKLVIPCMRLQLPGWEFPMEVGLEIGNRWGQTFAFAFDKKTFDILEPKSEPIPEFEEEKEEEKEVEEQKLTEVQEFLFNTDGEEIVF